MELKRLLMEKKYLSEHVDLMKKYNVDIDAVLDKMEGLEKEGKTAMLAAIDGQLCRSCCCCRYD